MIDYDRYRRAKIRLKQHLLDLGPRVLQLTGYDLERF